MHWIREILHCMDPTSDRHPVSHQEPLKRFFELLSASLRQSSFVKLILAKPTGAEADMVRVTARLIQLRGEACLTFVYSYPTRDITKNLPIGAGIARLRELVGPSFKNAHLHTADEEVQLAIGKKGRATLTSAKVMRTDVASSAHNREKQRWLDLTRPFLTELGVTTAQHQLIPAMSRKWKQINKFIEVFAHALAASPLAQAKQLNVVDFGSGKGYLTFAIHDWLRNVKGIAANATGVELKPDMVKLCNDAIAKLNIVGLRIEEGDIRSYQPEALNVMIALHACDVATDYAIHLGIRSGAGIIMCSPCCHKQLRPQLRSPLLLQPILHHGVHMGQEAEMVTDGLRALLLEANGYDTQVFEFIALEHTNKNKMILAVKRATPKAPDEVLMQIAEIKKFYGIREQCLESLLKADSLAAQASAES
ncbi:MAG TPA: SAM-dependent methyltransferase [Steroidobacteraceae bacterium]|nr:SAM-dependent methyltransferase [Steroidobacteraceae bacterium]